MPKIGTKLEAKILYKGPSSNGKVSTYDLYLEWDSKYLYYKKNIKKKLDFTKVVKWDAKPGKLIQRIAKRKKKEDIIWENKKIWDGKYPPRIVLWTKRGNKTEEREFAFDPNDFETCLYWVIRSVFKYSSCPLSGEALSLLKVKNVKKLNTFSKLNAFDKTHELFISLLKRWHEVPDTPSDAVRTTKGGMNFSDVKKQIGSGGSNTVIVQMNKLLADKKEPVKTEAMAVKLASIDKDCVDENRSGTALGELKSIIRETRILAAIGRHPNIVGLLDAHALSKTRILLFMEMGHGTLNDYIPGKKKDPPTPLTPKQIKEYAIGVLSGISHMHESRIYHLDMKPENVIICEGDVPKIIDFGLSKAKILDSKKEMLDGEWDKIGTPGYMPPESWEKKPYATDTNLAERDAYAVGLIILESLLAPHYKWKVVQSKLENRSIAIKKIKNWENKIQDKSNMKKLQRDGLDILAIVALNLINENPEYRFKIKGALEILKEKITAPFKPFLK
jgi:serine/threonine protein kinase